MGQVFAKKEPGFLGEITFEEVIVEPITIKYKKQLSSLDISERVQIQTNMIKNEKI